MNGSEARLALMYQRANTNFTIPGNLEKALDEFKIVQGVILNIDQDMADIQVKKAIFNHSMLLAEEQMDFENYSKFSKLYLGVPSQSPKDLQNKLEVYTKRASSFCHNCYSPDAKSIRQEFIDFVTKADMGDKALFEALRIGLRISILLRDNTFITAHSKKCWDLSKQFLDDKTAEYAEVLKNYAISLDFSRQFEESYKIWLDVLDVYKYVHQGEEHQDIVNILMEMATLKANLRQVEDALNILERAKKIQKKISSEKTFAYKELLDLEKKILGAAKEFEKFEQGKRKGWSKGKGWSKRKGWRKESVVLGVVSAIVIAGGIWYYRRAKN